MVGDIYALCCAKTYCGGRGRRCLAAMDKLHQVSTVYLDAKAAADMRDLLQLQTPQAQKLFGFVTHYQSRVSLEDIM